MKPIILFLIILLAGCASPPRQELQSARSALTQAQHADAPTLSPIAFGRAAESLRRGEALIREKEYAEARKVLPLAEEQARQALRLAERERERLKQERAAAAATIKVPSPAAPLPVRPPAKPAAPAPTAEPPPEIPPALTRYTVKKEETLSSIAARDEIYGDELLWPLLYQANRDQIRDPRQIYPGQILTIPRELPPGELDEIRERARRSDIFPHAGRGSTSGAITP